MSSSKAIGPNSIPIRILKLIKDPIADHLKELYNLSFSIGTFPSIVC